MKDHEEHFPHTTSLSCTTFAFVSFKTESNSPEIHYWCRSTTGALTLNVMEKLKINIADCLPISCSGAVIPGNAGNDQRDARWT